MVGLGRLKLLQPRLLKSISRDADLSPEELEKLLWR